MNNPTINVDIEFDGYVRQRSGTLTRQEQGGQLNYLYCGDESIRKKLDSIKALRSFAKNYTSHIVPELKRIAEMQYLKVGSKQFPYLNDMAYECAKRLCIAVPTIYIQPAPDQLDSDSFATNDVSPVILLTSAIVERMTENELFFIIGHECGHIQNLHGIYMRTAGALTNDIKLASKLVGLGVDSVLFTWVRAAEISADRAGAICCGSADHGLSMFGKLVSGAMLSAEEAPNIDALMTQLDSVRETPVRFLEIMQSSPLLIRRMYALKEFSRSELFYEWNPQLKNTSGDMLKREILEARCDKYVSVTKKG